MLLFLDYTNEQNDSSLIQGVYQKSTNDKELTTIYDTARNKGYQLTIIDNLLMTDF